jgi:hypothetical protein
MAGYWQGDNWFDTGGGGGGSGGGLAELFAPPAGGSGSGWAPPTQATQPISQSEEHVRAAYLTDLINKGEYNSADWGGGYIPDANLGAGQWVAPENNSGWSAPGVNDGTRIYRDLPGGNKSVLGATKASRYNGTQYDRYDASGNYTGQGTWEGLGGGPTPAVGVAMMAGGIGAAMMGAGAAGAAGGAGSTGGAGAGAGAGGMGNGAFLGEAAWAPTAGGGAMPGGFGAAAGGAGAASAGGASGGLSSALQSQLVKAGLGSALSGLVGEGGGSGSGGGLDLGSIIAGGADYYGQNKASGELLKWLKERSAITDNLYKPGSPEHNLMQQEMERKDAAAGRNSQYGTRAVDLAAKVAQIKAAENTKMTVGVGNLMKEGFDQRASAPAGLMAALGGQNGGAGLGGLLGSLGGSNTSGTNSSWYDSLFGIGQDGSNAPGGATWGSDIGDDDLDTWAGLI